MLKKAAMFTDLHLGRMNNSEVHNTDCTNYIEWFCEQVESDKKIDHIYFLGDWHEHRAAINGVTLKYSLECAKRLNKLNLPIYFVTGNHDMHYRNTRDVFSTAIFESLSNFTIINEITVLKNVYGEALVIPYLIEEEYDELLKHKNVPVALGHLELAGFVLSGVSTVLEHGPDHRKFFKKQKRVFSGHFHKRQHTDNIHYIGNTFPMDFSDANDTERGMATYDFEKDDLVFIDWAECPKYIKTKLSDLLESPKTVLEKGARVRVIVDQAITLTENNEIKKKLTEKYGLRGIVLEEQIDTTPNLSDIEQEVEDMKLDTVAEIIPELLKRIQSDKINSDTLVSIYRSL